MLGGLWDEISVLEKLCDNLSVGLSASYLTLARFDCLRIASPDSASDMAFAMVRTSCMDWGHMGCGDGGTVTA